MFLSYIICGLRVTDFFNFHALFRNCDAKCGNKSKSSKLLGQKPARSIDQRKLWLNCPTQRLRWTTIDAQTLAISGRVISSWLSEYLCERVRLNHGNANLLLPDAVLLEQCKERASIFARHASCFADVAATGKHRLLEVGLLKLSNQMCLRGFERSFKTASGSNLVRRQL